MAFFDAVGRGERLAGEGGKRAAGQDLVLGMDIGGTKLQVAVGRASGELLREARIDGWTSGNPERDLEQIAQIGRRVLAEAGVEARALAAIGVSAPGPLDPAAGVVRDAPNLPGWHEVPISARLAASFGRPVRLENDANAAALAEWRFGAGRGSRHFAFLTMSTGVGAGLILDGRLYRGARFGAGEIGHVPVVPNGRYCVCGLQGCLEAYTGGAALAARIRSDAAAGARTSIVARAGGDPARVGAVHWVEALRAGEGYARELAEEFLDTLAQGLAILVLGLDLERIALGTIIARNPDLFLEPLRARFAARVWPRLRDTRIVPAELGPRLSHYAGLCTALLELESSSLSEP